VNPPRRSTQAEKSASARLIATSCRRGRTRPPRPRVILGGLDGDRDQGEIAASPDISVFGENRRLTGFQRRNYPSEVGETHGGASAPGRNRNKQRGDAPSTNIRYSVLWLRPQLIRPSPTRPGRLCCNRGTRRVETSGSGWDGARYRRGYFDDGTRHEVLATLGQRTEAHERT